MLIAKIKDTITLGGIKFKKSDTNEIAPEDVGI